MLILLGASLAGLVSTGIRAPAGEIEVSGWVETARQQSVEALTVELLQEPSECEAVPALRSQPAGRANPKGAVLLDGSFRLAAPVPGLWRVVVVAAGRKVAEGELSPLISPTNFGPTELNRQEDSPAFRRLGHVRGRRGPQEKVVLLGRVVDEESGQGIGAALVWLAGRMDCYTTTDATGSFLLAAPDLQVLEELAVAKRGYAIGGWPAGRFKLLNEIARLSPAPGVIRGTVVGPNGRPLSRVRVTRDHPHNFTYSGLAGEFRFDNIPLDSRGHLSLVRGDLSPRRVRAQITLAELPTEPQRFVVFPKRTLNGRVLDGNGRALDGALITLGGEPSREPRAVTSTLGRFTLSEVSSGHHFVTMTHPSFATLSREIDVPDGVGPFDLGDSALPLSSQLSGLVLGPEDTPLEGAEIYVLRDPRDHASLLYQKPKGEPADVSDADGRFAIDDLEAGKPVELRVWRKGYQPLRRRLALSEGPEEERFQLTPAIRLLVRVLDEAGSPLERVTTRLESGADAQDAFTSLAFAETDRRGEAIYEAAPSGRATLHVMAPGYSNPKRVVELRTSEPEAELEISLRPEGTLLVRVVDGVGAPLEGALVRLLEERSRLPSIGLMNSSDSSGEAHLMMLPTGPGEFEISHPKFRAQRQRVDILPGEQRLEVTLGSEQYLLSGRVVLEDGAPAAGRGLELRRRETGHERYTTLGADGSFSFDELPSGSYLLSLPGSDLVLRPSDRVVEVVEEDLVGLELVAVEPCTIEGRLVGLSPQELSAVLVRSRSGGFGGGARVFPDDSTFHCFYLTPGEWELEATVPSTGRTARATARCDRGQSPTRVDLVFEARP